MRCEGIDIVIRDSGSNLANKQRAMAIQAVLIQLTLSIFEDYLELYKHLHCLSSQRNWPLTVVFSELALTQY